MLPIYLSIKGLYSYQTKQEIDFTKLTEAGLFGIFGKVGSGKSSILEAISMALYGETERLNKSDSRGYNMLNLKSDAAEIVFDFLNFNAKKYRMVVSWKRKKKYNETESISRKAYIWHLEQWLPIDKFDGSEIVGLSYENFKRTIIIPQGQFKEFLELKETERSNMMMQIFGLQRYNLYDKAKTLLNQNQASIDQLSGQLLTYEDVNEEMIQQLDATFLEVLKKTEQARQTLAEKQSLYEKQELLKKNVELLQLRKSEYDVLIQQESTQLERQKLVQSYTKAYDLFNTPFSLRKISQTKLKEANEEFNAKEIEFSAIVKTCDEATIRLNFLQEEMKLIPAKEQELRDYDLIIELKSKLAALESAKSNFEKFENQVKKGQLQFDLHQQELQEIRSIVSTLRGKKRDSNWLLDVSTWYQQKDIFVEAMNSLEAEVNNLLKSRDGYNQALELIIPKGDNVETYFQFNLSRLNSLLNEKEQILSQLRVKAALVDFAEHLHDGAACPLCGALEHPAIISDTDTAKELQGLELEISRLKNEIDSLQSSQQKANQLVFQLNEALKVIDAKNMQVDDLKTKLHQHQASFKWSDLSKDDPSVFEEIKMQDLKLSNELKEAEISESNAVNNLETTRKNFETVKLRLDEAKLAYTEKLAVCKSMQSGLSQKMLTLIENSSHEELLSSSETLKESIRQFRNQFETQSLMLNEKLNFKSLLEGQISQLKVIIQNETTTLNSIITTIVETLAKSEFQDEEQLHDLFKLVNEIPIWRDEVEKYFEAVNSLKAVLSQLESQLEGAIFDAAQFASLAHDYELAKLDFESLLSESGKLEGHLSTLKKRFLEKGTLSLQMQALEKRHQLIDKLVNMFKGNGFVNYVSSIYLEQLASVANQRFHRLTRNQLSLRVNDKGDFEIVDYLNDGASRSVKTLSGGQAFQASLCLALALAESVQTTYNQEKNFFFIDEGFGTQDEESTNMVYETLQSLVKEDRIVGIISHVGDLQERIPKAVIVNKDEVVGSQLMLA